MDSIAGSIVHRWRRTWAVLLAGSLVAFGGSTVAVAQVAGQSSATFALVIGSNLGGPGQAPLRYAERDARRVRETLVSLGPVGPESIVVLTRPTRQQLSVALDELDAALQRAAQSGTKTTLFVYYSGHARAQALNLGDELFNLAELRTRIEALPSALKVVILDACQSGAFSRPKGAQPTADFSYNSVEQLRTAGIAVMASSSASELSQESEELEASYFTHHLLVALRGGGDANHDGTVTLAETYEYAYHRTLTSTAETAIGGQHVTLETELRGEGDIALSHPARADALLNIPAEVAGDIVVTQLPSRSVVAEVHKVRGEALPLALPAGRYSIVVRQADATRRCDAHLERTAPAVLTVSACPTIVTAVAAAKGGNARPRETWSVQLGVGFASHHRDAYEARLKTFGYGENGNRFGRLAISAGYALWPNFVLSGQAFNLDSRQYSRDTQDVSQNTEWHAYGLGPAIRVQPQWQRWFPYVELGLGATVARTYLDEVVVNNPDFVPALGSDQLPDVRTRTRSQWHAGGYVSAAAGLAFMFRHIGAFAQLSWTYAPTIGNRLGDTHDVGGIAFLTGLRLRGVALP